MVIPLPCALSSFSSTWSSSPSFYVHSFMILLIISCTKSCGLVAISLCHLLLHHVYCLWLIQTTWHNSISNLMSLITKTKLELSHCLHNTDIQKQHLRTYFSFFPFCPTAASPKVLNNTLSFFGLYMTRTYEYSKLYDLWLLIRPTILAILIKK
jgi:hypothetical protein